MDIETLSEILENQIELCVKRIIRHAESEYLWDAVMAQHRQTYFICNMYLKSRNYLNKCIKATWRNVIPFNDTNLFNRLGIEEPILEQ